MARRRAAPRLEGRGEKAQATSKPEGPGVKLVSISYTQLKLASTANEHQSADEALDLRQRSERTFVIEEEENEHYMGTHWDMFFNEPKEAFKQLPEIVPQAIPMMGWASFQEPSPYHRNRKWPEAICLSWPRRKLGVLMVIKPSEQSNALESFFPFVGKGAEHTITINRVHVWHGGFEAQISAKLGSNLISFFDPLYVINREWYVSGNQYQFILTGLAYSCRKAKNLTMDVRLPEDARKAILEALGDEAEDVDIDTLHTQGMAGLLPTEEGDIDEYEFRGPVKAVEGIEMLGQPAWKLRTTVTRDLETNDDVDLDIIVTHKAWEGGKPPKVGEDIEGFLWLQGFLWMPR